MDLLTAQQIYFGFNEKSLFNNFNLTVAPGSLLHLKGENGAGKTTLLKLLAGFLRPISGDIRWYNQRCVQNTFYLGTKLGVKPEWTVVENIQSQQLLAGVDSTQSLTGVIQALSLADYQHRPVSQLSTGLTRRVALTQLLTTTRQIWLLDEPFSGLDTQSINWLMQTISQHVARMGAVIFTSHQTVQFAETAMTELLL